MTQPKILTIDQGTTSSRAVIFDLAGAIVAMDQHEFAQYFPESGWVEHDPEEIWQSTLQAVKNCLSAVDGASVKALGITNQRETIVLWDRQSGIPLYHALVWQDRRTAHLCEALKGDGKENLIRDKTGLLLDPYFSATKIAWLLDHIPGARARAEQGKLAAGTIDSFLIYRLTAGHSFVTDATNASRTSLYNINTGCWDDDLLELFNIPKALLPDVLDSVADFGTARQSVIGFDIPIRGVAGDQQAATVGQACFDEGDTKATYGTGAFMLMNTGQERVSVPGLLTTIAYQLNGQPTYALEGSIFVAGAVVQWLRDQVKIIDKASDTGPIVAATQSTGGVYFVPAFTGLGAPNWDPEARGLICGLSRGTGQAELVRAALESVAYQTADLFDTMAKSGIKPQRLRVDGGMVANDWLVQFLSDVLALQIDRPQILETTALGAAYLAGLGIGLFGGLDDIKAQWTAEKSVTPKQDDAWRVTHKAGWRKAVARAML